jgi:hypothetical protein
MPKANATTLRTQVTWDTGSRTQATIKSYKRPNSEPVQNAVREPDLSEKAVSKQMKLIAVMTLMR